MIRVANVDVHYEKARAAGAKVTAALVSYPYGERQYSVEDFRGHVWTFSQTEGDIEPRAWGGMLM